MAKFRGWQSRGEIFIPITKNQWKKYKFTAKMKALPSDQLMKYYLYYLFIFIDFIAKIYLHIKGAQIFILPKAQNFLKPAL